MRFRFRFLTVNGGLEWHTFTADCFSTAIHNAVAWSQTAFEPGELYDFWWEA